jgi:hypothetical protein
MSSKSPWWRLLLYKYLPFLFIKCRAGNYHWKWDKYCKCMIGFNGRFCPEPLHYPVRIDKKNKVIFTCSDEALEAVKVLIFLRNLGKLGGSREIFIEGAKMAWFFDGDGAAKIGTININKMNIKE